MEINMKELKSFDVLAEFISHFSNLSVFEILDLIRIHNIHKDLSLDDLEDPEIIFKKYSDFFNKNKHILIEYRNDKPVYFISDGILKISFEDELKKLESLLDLKYNIDKSKINISNNIGDLEKFYNNENYAKFMKKDFITHIISIEVFGENFFTNIFESYHLFDQTSHDSLFEHLIIKIEERFPNYERLYNTKNIKMTFDEYLKYSWFYLSEFILYKPVWESERSNIKLEEMLYTYWNLGTSPKDAALHIKKLRQCVRI